MAQPTTIPIIASAAIEAAGNKPATFEVVAYTGGKLLVNGYTLPVVIDLVGLAFDERITANMDHDPKQRIGHVTDQRNDGRSVVLAGVVSAAGQSAQEFVESGKNDYPWQASVEVRPTERPELVHPGQSVTVNGQQFNGPIFVARKSLLYGIAFLARGADDRTVVSIAASSTKGAARMNFDQWVSAIGLEPSEITDQQRTKLESHFGKRQDINAEPAFNLGEINAAAQTHDSVLESVFAEFHKLPDSKLDPIRAAAQRHSTELFDRAVREQWPAPRLEAEQVSARCQARVACIRAERPQGPQVRASTIDNVAPVIEAAIAISAGLPNLEEHYGDRELNSADQHFRGFGLQQLILGTASQNGYHARPGEHISQANLRTVLQFAFPPIHASNASTISLSGILSNVANKMILEGFQDEDQTWREISTIKRANNFHQMTNYRLLDNLEYEEVGSNGEIAHGELTDESYTTQVATYAKMLGITRTQIINDDLGAFDDLRIRLGRGASRKFNKVFWLAFLNNASFFTTERGNYFEGAATNLQSSSLATAVQMLRKMKTPDGKKVGGRGSILLVPPELETSADELYVSTNLNTGGTNNASKDGDANTHYNKYKPVVVDELSDDDYAGYSTTAWYLFRARTNLAPMAVSFLNGMQTPTVETADADFNQLGVQFRGYHDFGCDKAEYVAGVKSKGAA